MLLLGQPWYSTRVKLEAITRAIGQVGEHAQASDTDQTASVRSLLLGLQELLQRKLGLGLFL